MSIITLDDVTIDIDKIMGILDFIPDMGWSWNWHFDLPDPLGAVLFIVVFTLGLAVFFFPLWYVYTLKESTTRIEGALLELGCPRANPLEDEEAKSCPMQ